MFCGGLVGVKREPLIEGEGRENVRECAITPLEHSV